MFATRRIHTRMVLRFLGDTTGIRAASPAQVLLLPINAPFTPSPNLVVGDLSFQTVDTVADHIDGDPTKAVFFLDVPSQTYVAGIEALLSQWFFQAAGAMATPWTLYGAALVKHDKSVLYATAALAAPVPFIPYVGGGPLTAQGAYVPPLNFLFPHNMVR